VNKLTRAIASVALISAAVFSFSLLPTRETSGPLAFTTSPTTGGAVERRRSTTPDPREAVIEPCNRHTWLNKTPACLSSADSTAERKVVRVIPGRASVAPSGLAAPVKPVARRAAPTSNAASSLDEPESTASIASAVQTQSGTQVGIATAVPATQPVRSAARPRTKPRSSRVACGAFGCGPYRLASGSAWRAQQDAYYFDHAAGGSR
jgi:hypothetical protein